MGVLRALLGDGLGAPSTVTGLAANTFLRRRRDLGQSTRELKGDQEKTQATGPEDPPQGMPPFCSISADPSKQCGEYTEVTNKANGSQREP